MQLSNTYISEMYSSKEECKNVYSNHQIKDAWSELDCMSISSEYESEIEIIFQNRKYEDISAMHVMKQFLFNSIAFIFFCELVMIILEIFIYALILISVFGGMWTIMKCVPTFHTFITSKSMDRLIQDLIQNNMERTEIDLFANYCRKEEYDTDAVQYAVVHDCNFFDMSPHFHWIVMAYFLGNADAAKRMDDIMPHSERGRKEKQKKNSQA
ncbi:MAG: hypothetical protein GY938_05510, partial [Ketobacter sp.]|nr:hypothetical protein [Ketobacter sp.]